MFVGGEGEVDRVVFQICFAEVQQHGLGAGHAAPLRRGLLDLDIVTADNGVLQVEEKLGASPQTRILDRFFPAPCARRTADTAASGVGNAHAVQQGDEGEGGDE